MLMIKSLLFISSTYIPLVSCFVATYPKNLLHRWTWSSNRRTVIRSSFSTSSFPSLLHEEVLQFLSNHTIGFETISHQDAQIIALGRKNEENGKYKLGLHLIPFPHHRSSLNTIDNNGSTNNNLLMNPKTCKDLTDTVKQSPFETIIHLHEDVWQNKHEITKARILAKMNMVKNRWFARNTVAERISVTEAMEFLEDHHLWQSTRAKYNYGLFTKQATKKATGKRGKTSAIEDGEKRELLAVATFSPRRHVKRLASDETCKHSRMYRSHELIRYCAKRDEVVVGGITKLLAKFCHEVAPDDIVTCIDRDFGDGEGWSSIGFEKVQVMPPLLMVVGQSRNTTTTIANLQRRYLVGAGVVDVSDNNTNRRKSARPGIDVETYSSLCNAKNAIEGEQILLENNYWPVYDSGVERRLLLVQRSKMRNHALSKKEELELDDLEVPESYKVLDVWNDSKPSFPNSYYSPNEGIELLLQKASSS